MPDFPLRLICNSLRWFQICANLTDNAIKFTTAGEIKVRILLTDQEHRAIEGLDTGMEIPEEHRPYIFSAFQEGNINVTQSCSGIGLGLSLVKQLVDLIAGTISLKTRQGKGKYLQWSSLSAYRKRRDPPLQL